MFEEKVNEWIKNNFYEYEIEVKNFSLVPGGKIITDRKGKKMLVWIDLNTNKICYSFQDEKGKYHKEEK